MKPMEYATTLALGAVSILFGWLHIRQGKLESRLDNCVQKDAFKEVKEELKIAIKLLTEVRVENARWQGLVEKAIENNSKKS